jgi:hypothetical protein
MSRVQLTGHTICLTRARPEAQSVEKRGFPILVLKDLPDPQAGPGGAVLKAIATPVRSYLKYIFSRGTRVENITYGLSALKSEEH